MIADLVKLKALATATAANQHDALALNDYGMAVPSTTVLDLIADLESHPLIDTEGCKPDLSNQLFNGINSGEIQQLIQAIGTPIPYVEAEASDACCEKKAIKGSAAPEGARGSLNEIRSKNCVGVAYA